MVHVGALPGTPRNSLPLTQIIDQACREAEAYKDAGVDGLMVENMHDVPYTVCPGPEVTAAMAMLAAAVRHSCPRVPLGVQVLCAANQQAIAIALAAGLDFIRAEGFVFSHVADEGIINACAGDLLRYRKYIGADNIQIFADIKKKHRSEIMAHNIPLRDEASSPMSHSLDEVKNAVKIPVLVGSGVTLENVRNYLDADALIIGSYFKKEGYWANAVDPDRVKKFMEHISKLRE
ncbi:hypothetical protein DUI87_14050 [Hirundo rustica rustica]|uniref:BtpA family membrane complex biogenesis protein n=1 Tax=Hirundo rustica rustica TaxID=333673 RepID=A0A3M0K766_HIRRU|nr:hypothetical protein DUI87_14050 [Hirundo rustica rustica]